MKLFDNLSDDVIMKIFCYVGRTHKTISQVDKKWQKIVKSGKFINVLMNFYSDGLPKIWWNISAQNNLETNYADCNKTNNFLTTFFKHNLSPNELKKVVGSKPINFIGDDVAWIIEYCWEHGWPDRRQFGNHSFEFLGSAYVQITRGCRHNDTNNKDYMDFKEYNRNLVKSQHPLYFCSKSDCLGDQDNQNHLDDQFKPLIPYENPTISKSVQPIPSARANQDFKMFLKNRNKMPITPHPQGRYGNSFLITPDG